MRSHSKPSDVNRFWRDYARRYDRAVFLLNRRFDAMARQVAETVKGSANVLEVAAGTGLVSERLAPEVGRLVATDSSPEMLNILAARMKHGGHTNVEIQEADAEALEFEDGVFDALVMANLLHLLPRPTVALREATRVLRVGGALCAPTFCHGEHLVARGISRALGLVGFPVVNRFSGRSLAELFESAGFHIELRQKYAGLLPLWLVVARRL